MREVVLDTETTGLDPSDGHRVVEVGCVELFNHIPTDRTFHRYLNPQRPMPPDAFAVHGLGDDFLRTQPKFATEAQAFLDFIGDAPLIIHNASFDMKFLNAELTAAGLQPLPMARAIDTVAMARRRFPGSSASLDALCRRFGVDNSARKKHGALLDAEILAEVYLELIGGRQPDLVLTPAGNAQEPGGGVAGQAVSTGGRRPRPNPLPPRLTEAEAEAHDRFIGTLGDGALWRRLR